MKKTDLQKFEMVTLKRSDIKEHPQNPRDISESAKKKLKGKMQEVGLLQPLIVNKRTMYLLGGHQRLATMDKLERYSEGKNDYEFDVAMVDIDEAQELEMLVFLNNPSSQGTWNLDLLAKINLEMGVNFENMGFDAIDVNMMFDGDNRFAEMFPDAPEVKEAKDALNEIKEHRKESTERMKEDQKIDEFAYFVFADKEEKAKVMKLLKVPQHEKYISGGLLLAHLQKS